MSNPTSPTDGGDPWLAQRLLKPRRRQQIEIWLDEAVRWEELQSCAVGRSFGHFSSASTDSSSSSPANLPASSKAPAPAPAPASSSSSSSSITSHQGGTVAPGSRPPPAAPSCCQVCGRHFAGEDEQGAPAAAAAAAATAASPGGLRGRFRGVMSAMGSSLRVTGGGGGSGSDGTAWDPALSTRMFSLVEGTTNDGSHSSSAASRLDSSDGGKRALDGRMARLRRAQRLLEKSRPKVGQSP